MRQKFLCPSPPPPAIRNAMAKAVERKQRGLPVFDFSSGNVDNLPLNQTFFNKFELSINQDLPIELRILAEGLKEGLINSYHLRPIALAYSPTGGTQPIKNLVIRYFRELHGVPLSDADRDKVIVTAGGQQAMTASLARAVFYISLPNNPTGYFSSDDLKTIVKVLSANDGGVIWDAPYLFTLVKITPSGAKFDKALLREKLLKLKRITERYYQRARVSSQASRRPA